MRLDLAQLDTKTANLDLRVIAADVDHAAVAAVVRNVAGAVEPCAALQRIGVGNKTFGIQFGAVQVMPGNPGTANVNLAIDADRHRLLIVIEDTQAQVIKCRPDQTWHGCVDFRLADRVVSGMHGDFRDAVHVHQTGTRQRCACGPGLQAAEVQSLTPEHHFTQRMLLRAAFASLDELAESAWRLVQNGDLLLADQRIEVIR